VVRTESQREQARQDAGHHQNGAEKDGDADRIEGSHERSQIAANICNCILIVAAVGRQGHSTPFAPTATMCPERRPNRLACDVVAMASRP